jgi:hypothetical protein
MAADSLKAVLANPYSDKEYHADFSFTYGRFTESVKGVGFRIRGNTSRDAKKKSFRVGFNTYTKGVDFHGLENLNLNGEHNDPSIIRSKLSWDIFRQMGVPAPRANHVALYINGAYFGLYMNVEDIDDTFLKSRFGSDSGNLYKCLYPADLAWKGSDPNVYKVVSGGRRVYELKTNETTDDYTDLRDFIQVINQSTNFAQDIEKTFNVDAFLKIMAVNVATGMWDDYWYNKNNYYLYKNPETGKFEFIPYDYDNTFGIDWVGQNWGTRNIYTWGSTNEARPLVTKLMAIPAYKARYSYYLNVLIEGGFKPENINPRIDQLYAMIKGAATTDTYRALDYGWTAQQFTDSYTTTVTSTHVKYGLKPYVVARRNSILTQIQRTNIAPILRYAQSQSLAVSPLQAATISVQVEDDQASPKLLLTYSFNAQASKTISMADDGTSGDTQANDGIFMATIPPTNQTGTIQWFIEANDTQGGVSMFPIGAPSVQASLPVRLQSIGLNEIMADNTKTIKDEAGEYDDWIELMNFSTQEVSLKGKYLTDDLANPNKWALPDVKVKGLNLLLIWADEDGTQGANHANFKLSKSGETVALYEDDGNGGFRLLDSVVFGTQQTDMSWARKSNGTWGFASPTPNAFSVANESNDTPKLFGLASVYPNPFGSSVSLDLHLDASHHIALKAFDLLGRELKYQDFGVLATGTHTLSLESASWANGVYFIQIEAENGTTTQRQMLKVVKHF